MCGSILDRRRQATAGIVVPMPTRAEDFAKPAAPVAEPPREERKPMHPADEHFAAATVPPPPRDDGSFSIFGVDTGSPMHTSDVPQGLHGPSVLGLGDEGRGGTDYLFEEEESHGGRKFLLFVALLAVGGLAYMQYRADTPVTSIWASIKARATGEQPAQKAAPQEPVATDAQPAQPTSTKSDAAKQAEDAQAASGKPASASEEKKDASESAQKEAEKNPPPSADENAAAKPPQAAQAEKPRKNSNEMIAKAQHPQSDKDTAEQDQEEETPARSSKGKPSAATESRRDHEDDALVTRAQGFLYGKGGAKSCNTAMSLLKQAAERGNAKADSQLGAMYATGNCAPFDRAEAYRWFTKASEADPGNSYLQRSRDMIWREMSPQERRKVLE